MSHLFTHSSADIILRSSDDVTFRLHRIILSLASDFFADMLSLPQPTLLPPESVEGDPSETNEIDGLPVVHVTETGAVLNKLLRICYPLDDPTLESIDEVRAVLEAALKYDMPKAIQIAKRRLRELASSAPLRAYVIACRFSLEDEARVAAQEVRDQKLQECYVEELEELPIAAYQRFLYYCESGRSLQYAELCFEAGGRNKTKQKRFSKKKEATSSQEDTSATRLTSPNNRSNPSSLGCASLFPPLSEPFFLEGADVVVETNDSPQFKIYGCIIQHASPILHSMITNASESSPELMILSMPEPGHIVNILFRICSPIDDPQVDDLLEIYTALVAAQKYQMQKAVNFLTKALATRLDASPEEALLSYAIACSLGMQELALSAAQRTLRTKPTSTIVPQLDYISVSGAHLYRLLDYHRRCRAAARSIFDNRDWIAPEWKSRLQSGSRRPSFGMSSSGNTIPCWFAPYMDAIAEDAWPSNMSVLQDAVLERGIESRSSHYSSQCCSYCADRRGALLLCSFSRYVADTIDKLEKEVPLNFGKTA